MTMQEQTFSMLGADEDLSPVGMLADMGVSIWLDDLSRDRLDSGSLRDMIRTRHVSGVTTNPTIFAAAVTGSDAYRAQLDSLASRGTPVSDAVWEIVTADITRAAGLLEGVHRHTHGLNGRVSIEVDPSLSRDACGTVRQASDLISMVNRPNIMVKIPGTVEGLEAITEATARGISVNVTLLFDVDRYRQVIRAYFRGLERAQRTGVDLSTIYSVASFFVSRVDVEVDRRLAVIDTPAAHAPKGLAGLANARIAFGVYEEEFASVRACRLLAHGAHPQRPLWASTGVKDPSFRDTLYVEELVAPGTVNTMPPATLDAVADHGVIASDTIHGKEAASRRIFDRLADLGIDYADVTRTLEDEGLTKFEAAWAQLHDTVAAALASRKP